MDLALGADREKQMANAYTTKKEEAKLAGIAAKRQARLAWPNLQAHNRHLRKDLRALSLEIAALSHELTPAETKALHFSAALVIGIKSLPAANQNTQLLTEHMRARRLLTALKCRQVEHEIFENFKKENP